MSGKLFGTQVVNICVLKHRTSCLSSSYVPVGKTDMPLHLCKDHIKGSMNRGCSLQTPRALYHLLQTLYLVDEHPCIVLFLCHLIRRMYKSGVRD